MSHRSSVEYCVTVALRLFISDQTLFLRDTAVNQWSRLSFLGEIDTWESVEQPIDEFNLI